MRIVMIHGRDQQKKDSALLRKTWIDTLNKGLKSNNLNPLTGVDIIFPYYGDLLDNLISSSEVTTIQGVIAKGALSKNEIYFYYEILMEIAENNDIKKDDIEKNYVDNKKEKGPLNWGWVQAIMKTIDAKTPLGNWSIEKFTRDVFLYLTNPIISDKINKFVKKAFDSTPTVVIAHSLGTVVAYNVLRNNPKWNITKFITVGSPLGLESIKSKLIAPLTMPLCVKNGWYNAYDERDFVALHPLDKKHFNISPSIINKNTVDNSTKNRHGIIGYLNDKDVAKTMYDNLV